MLKSLKIENFQSHKHTEITFDPNITCFIGRGDSGKSAIIRVLEWIRTNRPLGASFIKHGELHTTVHLTTENGTLKRRKSKAGNNEYELANQKFTALKTEVPLEVANFLNLNDINVQTQFDPPFMILDTPGAVASKINTATQLDKIDLVLQELQKRVRSTEQEKVSLQKELTITLDQLKEFPDLAKAKALIDELEIDESSYLLVSQDLEKIEVCLKNLATINVAMQAIKIPAPLMVIALKNAIATYQRIEQEKDKLHKISITLQSIQQGKNSIKIPNERLISTVKSNISKISELQSECYSIIRIRKSLVDTQLSITNVKVEINACPNIPQTKVKITSLGVLQENKNALSKETEIIKKLKTVLYNIESGKGNIQKELNLFLQTRKELINKIEDCPLCGSKLTETSRFKILENNL